MTQANFSKLILFVFISLYFSGCISIPVGKVWTENGGTNTSIVDEDPIKTEIRILTPNDKDEIHAQVMTLIEKEEVTKIKRVSEKSRRLNIGLFPSKGHMVNSREFQEMVNRIPVVDFEEKAKKAAEGVPFPINVAVGAVVGSVVISYDLCLAVPWAITCGGVAMAVSTIMTPISWFTEFGRDWEPIWREDGYEDCITSASLIGWSKSSKAIPRVEKYSKISSREYKKDIPCKNSEVIFTFPKLKCSFSKKTDPSGEVILDLRELPIFVRNKKEVIISSPKTSPRPDPITLVASHNELGINLVKRLFAGRQFPEQIYTDLPDIDGKGKSQLGPPRAVVKLKVLTRDASSNEVRLNLIVKNTGKDSLYQVFARTLSHENFLNNKLFFLGKIDPGQTVNKNIYATIPQDLKSGQYDVAIEFCERNQNEPSPISVSLDLDALPRPKLAFSSHIMDDSLKSKTAVGNADGVIQKGEAFDLVVTVKNIGNKYAKNTGVNLILPEDSSIVLFGEANQLIGNLIPEETKDAKFNILVKNTSKLSGISAVVSVAESLFKEQKVRTIKLPFDSKIPKQPMVTDRMYYVSSKNALLRSGASENASLLGQAPKGAQLKAVAELTDWAQVKIPKSQKSHSKEMYCWVNLDSLTTKKPISGNTKTTVLITPIKNRPPQIAFVEPRGDIDTTDKTIRFIATVVDVDSKIKDVFVKYSSDSSNARSIQPIIRNQKDAEDSGDSRVIEYVLDLKQGKNVVSVTARDENDESATRSITISRFQKKGKVILVSIGINKYPQPYTLYCAKQDSERFAEFAKSNLGVEHSNVYLLTDEKANRRNIMSIFGKLRRKLKKEDTLVVSLSGHGMIDRIADCEDKYFLPVDTDTTNLFASAIDMERFQSMLNVQAERVLVIADVCYGGNIRLKGGTEQLFDSLQGKGRILIGYTGPAREDKTLGAGYLTHYFLEGLKGPANKDKDSKITLREAYEYASEKIRKITGSGLWIKGEGDLELLTTYKH